MFKNLKRLVEDTLRLWSNSNLSFSKRLFICINYKKIILKRFLDGRVGSFKKERFLGFKVMFDSYNDFFWTYREIFVLGDYYFYTDKKEPVCVDAGGNIGITTLYFKYIYPDAKVYTFEPEPHNVELIKKNLKYSGINDVVVIDKALGAEKGQITFRGANRMGSIVQDFYESKKDGQIKKGRGEIQNEVDVEVVPLSEFLDEDHYDLLKLDIEGVESEVLVEINSKGLLEKIDRVILEYHHFSFEKNKLQDVIKVLEDNHFTIVFNSHFKNVNNLKGRTNYAFMVYAQKEL